MPITDFRLLTLTASLIAVPLLAQAQTAPPIKPGLWQVQSEREVNGQKAPDPMERMKDLPPEARKQMEAMMKKRGVDMGEVGGGRKVCHTRESLDQGRWKGDSNERCKTDITGRSASAWKWHSVCTQPESEMDGEALFANPENYTVKMLMTSQHQGKPQAMRMTITAKWIGADCGDLKPMQPPPPTK
jgi:hypothetical protein